MSLTVAMFRVASLDDTSREAEFDEQMAMRAQAEREIADPVDDGEQAWADRQPNVYREAG